MKVIKRCQTCNKSYTIHKSKEARSKYCSLQCKYIGNIRFCKVCKKVLPIQNERFCSEKCMGVSQRKDNTIEVKCITCSNSFYMELRNYNYKIKTKKQTKFFCSKSCYAESRKVPEVSYSCDCCGAEFSKKPYYFNRYEKHFCSRKCSQKYINEFINDSSWEKTVENFFIEKKIYYLREYKLEKYRYDFYLPDHNLLIEIDGAYWHNKDETVRKRDRYKNNLAREMGFSLLRFVSYDKKFLNNVIKDISNLIDTFIEPTYIKKIYK